MNTEPIEETKDEIVIKNRHQVMLSDEDVRRFGRNLALGFVDAASKLMLWIGAVALMFWLYAVAFKIGMDDSDTSSFRRSGLTVHTDAKTGIQYLSDGHGGLTPRLNNQPERNK